jgi:hypothetical protein
VDAWHQWHHLPDHPRGNASSGEGVFQVACAFGVHRY